MYHAWFYAFDNFIDVRLSWFMPSDSDVSVGTSAWGICVYSVPGGQIVLTGCISKSGCFSDNHKKAVCADVNVYDWDGKREYFSVIRLDL